MYLEHFGLREAPFNITPHTEFFFSGANRGATLEALIYAITHDEGIVKVSGEVGSGKTMLCRMLLEKLPKHVETVYLATPSLSREDILLAIADELRIELPDARPHQMMRALQEHLLELHASGRLVVVMIDEAHAMPAETLEEIRLLSNLETSRHKLLHIVLFGQPELDERLSDKSMRQLKDRITHNFALEPLHRDDIGKYLVFRLRAAGYRGPDLFTPSAVRLISQASQGLTRRINILADKGLLSAFADGQHLVDKRQIKAAVQDTEFPRMQEHDWNFTWISGGFTAVAATGLVVWWIGASLPPTERPSLLSAQSEPQVVIATQQSGTPAVESQPQRDENPASLPQASSPTLATRIAAADEWLKNTPETHYFIQLLSTDAANQTEVQQFIDNVEGVLDKQQLRVYRSGLSGRDRLGVIYGDYPNRGAATNELAQLTKAIPGSAPYIRTVRKLK